MPTINLPTEAERAAVDVDSFTWSIQNQVH